ncbi:MAG: AAA family ATPase, partial [Oscillospiraceae bacterium]|nr:AAA family ATPase [Oscillospiraceae bacterium]
PLIHVSDIDMQNSAIVNELLGRTGSADLRQVLNTDVGSVDTANLQGGQSNAQIADARNPHPDGLPFYEMTWKAVFLNSLVGRAEGKASKVFGISQQDAVFQLATPLLAPSQVRTALDEIAESAFYLRYEDGKYYAHVEPTINSILARIRQTVDVRQVQQKLKSVSDRLFTDFRFFRVEHDVHYPQDISDTRDALTVAVVSLSAGEINVKDMFQLKGDAAPRVRQNTVLLLVPKTVKVTGADSNEQGDLLAPKADEDAASRVDSIARQVLAIEALKAKPDAYGITAAKLRDPEFVEKERERSNALQTVVAEMYNSFYYYGQNSYERKELRTASGESGTTALTQILQILREAGKLVYTDSGSFGAANLKSLGDACFFKTEDKMPCADIYTHFLNYRSWPMLPDKETLVLLLREGVRSGVWVAYKRSVDPTDSLPAEFYSDKKELPYEVDLLNGGYSVMTMAGAKKRGWTQSDGVPNEKVKEVIHSVMSYSGAVTVDDLTRAVQSQHANATTKQVQDNIRDLIQNGGYSLYAGQTQQRTKPDEMVTSFGAYGHTIQPDEVLISRAEETERGWNSVSRGVTYSGNTGANKLKPLLGKLGSL